MFDSQVTVSEDGGGGDLDRMSEEEEGFRLNEEEGEMLEEIDLPPPSAQIQRDREEDEDDGFTLQTLSDAITHSEPPISRHTPRTPASQLLHELEEEEREADFRKAQCETGDCLPCRRVERAP